MHTPGAWGHWAAVLLSALVLAVSSAEAAQGRRGATVVVALKNGGERNGELVAVRTDSLVMVDPEGLDATVELSEARSVRIVRASKGGLGGLIGIVAGAAVGYLGGFALSASSGACPDCEAPLAGYGLGVIGGFVGLGAGALIGESAGRDIVIPLDAVTESERSARLRKLRRYARVATPL